jgi:Flp pilus assembly protein TadD
VIREIEDGGGRCCAAIEQVRFDALGVEPLGFFTGRDRAGNRPTVGLGKLGNFKAAIAQAENEKSSCHLVRITVTRFFSTMFFGMLFRRNASFLLLALSVPSSAGAQGFDPLANTPDHLRRYTECMNLARLEPLKALPAAEKWMAEGGGLGARHCVALAMFESGKHIEAATQFEAIARDMGRERPGLRAELWAQAGQAWIEAGQAENAAAAQSRALDLKADDPELWVDRGLSYAAMRAWPRAISDFDRALALRANDVEVLVLRAAAWRNSGDPARAAADAERALKIAPDHSEALLERGFDALARGDKSVASTDFTKVLRLVPPDSDAARRAEAGLRGELPGAAARSGGKR